MTTRPNLLAPQRSGRVVGTAASAVAELDELVAATEAQELMVSTVAHDLDVRIRSFELLAEAWSSPPGGVSS